MLLLLLLFFFFLPLFLFCSHINSHYQVRGQRTGSSHAGAEEYPRKITNQRWSTHISQLKQFMSPPETYQSEIGSQATTCQVHTGAYVALLAPGKTDYTACHPRKTTTYILHVVSITRHTHDRRKSNGKKQTSKKRKEDRGKKRQESEKRKRKSKKRNARIDKTRKESKDRKREKKNSY